MTIDDFLDVVLPALEPVRDRRVPLEYMRSYTKTVLLYYEQARVEEQLRRQKHDISVYVRRGQ